MGAIGGEIHLVPSARPFFKDLLSWCKFLILFYHKFGSRD